MEKDGDRGKLKISEKTLSQCLFSTKSHMD
jgi:hypothetical protein